MFMIQLPLSFIAAFPLIFSAFYIAVCYRVAVLKWRSCSNLRLIISHQHL